MRYCIWDYGNIDGILYEEIIGGDNLQLSHYMCIVFSYINKYIIVIVKDNI